MDGSVKIEYFLEELDGPILLIYGTERAQFKQFMSSIASLGEMRNGRVGISELPGFEPVGGLRLECVVGADVGVVRLASGVFEWQLSAGSWKAVENLIEPFCLKEPSTEHGVFQYLSEVGGIEVIVSTIRGW